MGLGSSGAALGVAGAGPFREDRRIVRVLVASKIPATRDLLIDSVFFVVHAGKPPFEESD
jgi:hypothetical protein